MVIDTNNINSSSGANGARRNSSAAVSPVTKSPTSTTLEQAEATAKDSVSLSPQAQHLTRLQSKMGSLPDVNMERVASIKLAIAQGRFEINPERIAENMLNQDELLG